MPPPYHGFGDRGLISWEWRDCGGFGRFRWGKSAKF